MTRILPRAVRSTKYTALFPQPVKYGVWLQASGTEAGACVADDDNDDDDDVMSY